MEGPPTKYETAGRGAYGIVIQPALPNNTRNYPNNVTKIFKEKNSYIKALSNAINIASKIPKLKTNIAPYRQKYKIRNLPNNIKRNVINFIDYEDETKNNSNVHMLRLPNLGISIDSIDKISEHYHTVRRLPYQKLCQEMYKCMTIVKDIYDSGYIHGDIRETNVLLNLSTSVLSIIDFDWLMPFEDFYIEYPVFFYSHPPEFLLIYSRPELLSNYKLRNPLILLYIEDIHLERLYNILDDKTFDIYNSSDAVNGIKEFKKMEDIQPFINKVSLNNDIRDRLFDIAKDYIDSYGLGMTFNKLLNNAWYQGVDISYSGTHGIGGTTTEEEFNKFNKIRLFIFNELIKKMTHSDYTKRWKIEEAIEKFEAKLREVGIEVGDIDVPAELAIGALVTIEELPRTNEGFPKSPESTQSDEEIVGSIDDIISRINSTVIGGKRRRRHLKTRRIRRVHKRGLKTRRTSRYH